MTIPAIYGGVTAGQGKIGLPMLKMKRVRTQIYSRHFGYPGGVRVKILPIGSINFPTCRIVAGSAVDLHVRAMRILGEKLRRADQKEKDETSSGQNG